MAETLNATERAGTTAVAESPTFKFDPRHVATWIGNPYLDSFFRD